MDPAEARSHSAVASGASRPSTRQQSVQATICRYQCFRVDLVQALCSAEALSLAKTLGEHGLCRLASSCKPWHRTERCIAIIAVSLQLCANADLASPVAHSPATLRRLRSMMQPQCTADVVWWVDHSTGSGGHWRCCAASLLERRFSDCFAADESFRRGGSARGHPGQRCKHCGDACCRGAHHRRAVPWIVAGTQGAAPSSEGNNCEAAPLKVGAKGCASARKKKRSFFLRGGVAHRVQVAMQRLWYHLAVSAASAELP